MHPVGIRCYCIARTGLDTGFNDWLEDITGSCDCPGGSSAETLIIAAGKRCYMSFKPGLNKNVTKVRQEAVEFINNILASGHGSVLEHATYTWAIEGVTRVFTGEMNRHRVGVAISEGSMRFIRYDDIPYWLPPDADDYFKQLMARIFSFVENEYKAACEHYQLDKRSFDEKKKITSRLRRILPMGTSTGGIWTMNIRALRHILTMRCSPHAEEEICWVMSSILQVMTAEETNLFGDFTIKDGYYEPRYVKV